MPTPRTSSRSERPLLEALSQGVDDPDPDATPDTTDPSSDDEAPRPRRAVSLVGAFTEGLWSGVSGALVVGTLGVTCGATYGWLNAPAGHSPADRFAGVVAFVILFGLLGFIVTSAGYALIASLQAMLAVVRTSLFVGLPLVAFIAWAGWSVWGFIGGSPLVPSLSDPPVQLLFLGGLLLFAAALGVFIPTAIAGVLLVAGRR